MATEIRWSNNAIKDYHSTIEYLLIAWNEETAVRFIEITEYKIRQISSHPHIGIRSFHADNVRSVLITRHNRLYYRIISEEIIEIANIFDTGKILPKTSSNREVKKYLHNQTFSPIFALQ